jgi:hypothetical protein
MKKELKQTLGAAQLTLVVLWPTSAWAASIAFGAQLAEIPMLSVLMTVILSTLMGATALLHAMKQEYEKAAVIPRLWLFVCSRMLSSNAAGLLMFFAGEAWGMDNAYKAAAIMLAAFGGTWSIERALQFFANKYAPEPTR